MFLSETDVRKNSHILEIMHQVASDLLNVSEEQEIYLILRAAVSKLLPGVFSIITKLQPDDMNFRIVDNSGFDKYFDAIEKLLGKSPYSIDFPFQDLTEEEQTEFNSRKLYYFENGIHGLSHGRISKLVCSAIEKMLHVSEVYVIGFSVEMKFFGGFILFIPDTIKLGDDIKFVIESIVNQSSSVIQRLRDRENLRKKEEVLQNTNLQIETLIENSRSGYLFEDVDRNILKINKEFCHILGVSSPDSLIGANCKQACRNFSSLFVEAEHFIENSERMFSENNAIFNEELEMLDGRVLERDFIPIKNGTIRGYLWQYRDISLRKQNEKKLREQTELLHELNQTKDKFFAIIAHDLKGPFSSILGITELLVKEYQNLSEEDRMESIQLLDKSANNTFKLLDNLLEWARIQRGYIDVKKEELHLNDLIPESIELLLPVAATKGIKVRINIKQNCSVFADENSIRTIIRNLFSNAIKYTSGGGLIQINAFPNGQQVDVSIKDTGIGMSPDLLGKLFRIEESQSRIGTDNESGTGLGLILCKDIIHKNGGSIWAESEVGKGSVFTFSIPQN